MSLICDRFHKKKPFCGPAIFPLNTILDASLYIIPMSNYDILGTLQWYFVEDQGL